MTCDSPAAFTEHVHISVAVMLNMMDEDEDDDETQCFSPFPLLHKPI